MTGKPRFVPEHRVARVLDGRERQELQAAWYVNVCPVCGRWHAGGGECPRVKSRTRSRTTATVVSDTVEYWQDGEYMLRTDDFTWDEVWGAAHVADYQQATEAEGEKRRKKKDDEK